MVSAVLKGADCRLRGISALDSYFGIAGLPFTFVETSADIQTLARFFSALRFPGPEVADCAVPASPAADSGIAPGDETAGGNRDWYFFCIDPDTDRPGFSGAAGSFEILDFFLDLKTGHFLDPFGVYPLLRQMRQPGPVDDDGAFWRRRDFSAERNRFLLDAALIFSRYDVFSPSPGGESRPARDSPESRVFAEICAAAETLHAAPPCAELQRIMLTAILLSERPGRGLELLKASGFIETYWNELALLDGAEHSKDFHPEGNAWKHTLETFRYRKTSDLILSLGLLLHDIGKPLAASSGRNRFDGHAELGAVTARRFLERLEFPPEPVNDICYLVKNHMLPAAIPRLPLSRTESIMSSRLFPVLLELYRCDESSSFKGLDQYYKSSAVYRRFLRKRKNPYR
ncbi:MAG: HD domain-containing protein [Treponema sp.]|jgi:poly(A) polymerase|nr:HD domain-containing protein [Treponema sp.]